MRRVFTTVALVLALAGCSSGEVHLLTGGSGGCWAGGEHPSLGQLVAEGAHGTTFNGQPVMWPVGYTARRAGEEVEVLDAGGNVRATTGRPYSIASMPDNTGEAKRARAFLVAVDCPYDWDFNDCSGPDLPDACDPQ